MTPGVNLCQFVISCGREFQVIESFEDPITRTPFVNGEETFGALRMLNSLVVIEELR